MACEFIKSYQIDSFFKLRFLLWLNERAAEGPTIEEIADRLFVGDVHALGEIIDDLGSRGLILRVADRFTVSDGPMQLNCLACLRQTFHDPLARQRLLDEIIARSSQFTTDAIPCPRSMTF